MDIWRLDTFESLLGQKLTAKELSGDNSVELEVAEVIRSDSLGEGWESFSVIFKSDTSFSQGNLTVTHSEHGDLTVFLTPKSDTEYEAVFSFQLD